MLLFWLDFSELCGSVVYAGVLYETEKQVILDVHNDLRRRVAKGLETRGNPGPQPPAANMRKLVSETSLTVHKLLITWINSNYIQYRNVPEECTLCKCICELRISHDNILVFICDPTDQLGVRSIHGWGSLHTHTDTHTQTHTHKRTR